LHYTPFLYIFSDEDWEFSLRYEGSETEGEQTEGESGPPGVYFVLTNKIDVILFFCIIPTMIFNIEMHNYFCFCSLQFPNLLFLSQVNQ